jgi:hypothetical protein
VISETMLERREGRLWWEEADEEEEEGVSVFGTSSLVEEDCRLRDFAEE